MILRNNYAIPGKTFAILLLLTAFSISLLGQTKLMLGAKSGISIPNLKAKGDNPISEGWSSRLGVYAGIMAEYEIGNNLYLQAEINYASQGGKKNGLQTIPTSAFANEVPPGTVLPTYVYGNYQSEVKLNYLELPVLLKSSITLSESISILLEAGPYAGFLINAKNITAGNGNIYLDKSLSIPLLEESISFDQNNDIKKDINSFNAGVQAGVGLGINLPNENKINIITGINMGFTPIQKDVLNGQNNTGAITITASYLFKSRK
ncbi:porin family protein [Limnovirga soli]|uniref:Outer membrane beta-barrel protein n=1 Tax=Limnovirga soli TaxID=2656915 RepID=A0A8J8FGU5_9BACT|nr:porin family protein [Limnovirga soli]NNV56738.1 outer membrane beta-barrel protein [Limnovirga soli]